MKYHLALLLIFYPLFSNLMAQEVAHRYFDQNGKEITELEQWQLFELDRGGVISVAINKGNWVEHRLVPRSMQGVLTAQQNAQLKKYLRQLRPLGFPEQYEAVIQFYPGKDRNNSTGSATANDFARTYNQMERKLRKWETPLPFYVYKDPEGIERRAKGRNWQLDPDHFIEKTFFRYHYPGSSYVVVDDKGRYQAFFGEFSIKGLLETVKQAKRNNA